MFDFGQTKSLPVPYHTQVSEVHCQSTVLKMYAQYLDRYKFPGKAFGNVEVPKIWSEINLAGNPDKRRNKVARNAHANIQQWLEDRYDPQLWKWTYPNDPEVALTTIVRSINVGFPVIAGVSHKRVEGHIVLIVGYVFDRFTDQLSSGTVLQSYSEYRSHRLIVHDPYGAFHPSLDSNLFGKNRFVGGSSMLGGGEIAAGKGVVLSLYDVSRQRGLKSSVEHGSFNLMAPL